MSNAALAFAFPGQGSQKVGMLSELAQHHEEVEATFAEASEVLGYDLWSLCQEGPQEKLNQTEVTQPLLLTSSIACYRVYQKICATQPSVVAGHSLGEWSALVAAGVLAFNDAVRLVARRGALMQAAVPAGEGAMAAILGLSDEAVKHVCEANDAYAVNFNCPGQVVVAGATSAVENVLVAAKEAGAKRALPLPVSAPFHTPMMKPAAQALSEDIGNTAFSAPQIPVIHNVNVEKTSEPADIKSLMVEQIYSPVLWTQTVERMIDEGVTTIIECGPGKVLCGLNKKVSRSLAVASLEDVAGLEKAVEMVNA